MRAGNAVVAASQGRGSWELELISTKREPAVRRHVMSHLGRDLDAKHGSKSHLGSTTNGFDSRDFMISANFLQKKIWRDKEDR